MASAFELLLWIHCRQNEKDFVVGGDERPAIKRSISQTFNHPPPKNTPPTSQQTECGVRGGGSGGTVPGPDYYFRLSDFQIIIFPLPLFSKDFFLGHGKAANPPP